METNTNTGKESEVNQREMISQTKFQQSSGINSYAAFVELHLAIKGVLDSMSLIEKAFRELRHERSKLLLRECEGGS